MQVMLFTKNFFDLPDYIINLSFAKLVVDRQNQQIVFKITGFRIVLPGTIPVVE